MLHCEPQKTSSYEALKILPLLWMTTRKRLSKQNNSISNFWFLTEAQGCYGNCTAILLYQNGEAPHSFPKAMRNSQSSKFKRGSFICSPFKKKKKKRKKKKERNVTEEILYSVTVGKVTPLQSASCSSILTLCHKWHHLLSITETFTKKPTWEHVHRRATDDCLLKIQINLNENDSCLFAKDIFFSH